MAERARTERALDAALERLRVRPADDEVRHGWAHKSAGRRVRLEDGTTAWLRVTGARVGQETGRAWDGLLDARSIRGVARPALLRHEDWTADGRIWRAVLLECADAPVCSPEPFPVNADFCPSDAWFRELRQSLEALAGHATERVAFPQELIAERIHGRFGDAVDPTVTRWITIHDDLHWSNLTCPDLRILDWEAWGRGPLGFDPALLLACSAAHPPLVARIRAHFGDWLDTRDGRLSQLLACHDVLAIEEERAEYASLRGPVERIVAEVLAEAG